MGTFIIFFIISLMASIVGALCGVGGGIFMKPSLDALGVLPVNTITFLSTCTVISMSSYNVLSNYKNTKSQDGSIDWNLTTWLAIGAAIGGIAGKLMYSKLNSLFVNSNIVGGYQAMALFVVVFMTLIYTLNKHKLNSLHVTNKLSLISLGLALGAISSFLGIGGGPMNLAVLCYFMSMSTKTAAQNSLYIILVSQVASLIMTFINGSIPSEFYSGDISIWIMLVGMIICGICGGIIGKKINKKISTEKVDKLFIILIYVILGLCVYNTITKLGLF